MKSATEKSKHLPPKKTKETKVININNNHLLKKAFRPSDLFKEICRDTQGTLEQLEQFK